MRLSTFVIIVGAVLLTAAPFSLQWTPRNVGLYVDKADARVVYRRVYRRPYVPSSRRLEYGYPAPVNAPYPYGAYPPLGGAFWSGWR
jgi:hypothetical protein